MMIIMTLKIITEIVNQIKTKEKKKRNNKSQTKTHTQKEEKKKTEAVVYNNKNKTIKNKKNKYSVTKMEQRDAKGSADSQNLISIFEKHHRCPN